MDNLFEGLDIFNGIDENTRINVPDIPLRNLRDADDPFAIDVLSFKRRYRFSQDSVKNIILPILGSDQHPHNRGLPVPLEFQALVCLRFYATASFQLVTGDLLNFSQPTVSRIIRKISNQLAAKLGNYIKYPNNLSAHRLQFQELGRFRQFQGLRNIDGAIDCTHIKLVNTPGIQHHEAYRNRKSYFSVNVQAVVGPTGAFMDIVARWAGSTHDSRIFQLSRINSKYRERLHDGQLVGDSGYPCLPYLLTPVANPGTEAEETFNIVQRKTRNIVERTFGMWKRRFPCLSRGLGNSLPTVSSIIVSCAILHNIAIEINEEVPDIDEHIVIEAHEDHEETLQNHSGTADGFAIRAAIVQGFVPNR